MVTCGKELRSFQILLYKNWLLKWRQPIGSVCELLLPIIFFGMFFFLSTTSLFTTNIHFFPFRL